MVRRITMAMMALIAFGAVNSQVASGWAQENPVRSVQNRYPITGPLLLNGAYLGDISAEVAMSGEGDIDRQRLLDLLDGIVGEDTLEQIRARAGQSVTTPMNALNFDGFHLVFESASLEFRASIPVDNLTARDVSIAGARKAPNPKSYTQPSDFSFGANIAAAQDYDHDDGRDPFVLDLLGFANIGGFEGVTISGGTAIREQSDGAGFELDRNDISASYDLYDEAIRISTGELNPSVVGMQEGQQILGFSVATRFSEIRPFENIRPSGRQELVLERDSTVEIEVNGVLAETIELSAGRYQLRDIPFADSANDVRLIIEDEAGRREVARLSLFNMPDLLEPGVFDFGFAAGVRRDGDVDDYDDNPIGTGYARFGVTNEFTLGLNAQASEDVGQAGLEAGLATELGFVNVGAAASLDRMYDETGYAFKLDYQNSFSVFDEDDVRFNGAIGYDSAQFSGLSDGETFNDQSFHTSAGLNFRLPIGAGLGLTGGYSDYRNGEPSQITGGVSLGFGIEGVGVSLSGSFTDQGGDQEFGGVVGLSYRFGERYSAQTRYSSRLNRAEVAVSRSPRNELNDISGRVRLSRQDGDNGEDYDAAVDLNYVGNRFEADLENNLSVTDGLDGETQQVSRVRASMGVGYTGGKFGVGRPFRSGFIIADKHETLADSELALTSSQGRRTEAHTDIFGPALVGINRPYSEKKLGIDVTPLPVGYDIGDGVIEVFPGTGAGYAFSIGSDASRTIMGYLKTDKGDPIALSVGDLKPMNGDEALARQFFTNSGGRFIAEKVAPGEFQLVLDGKAIGEITIPEDGEALIDVGTIIVTATE